ncbi:MAG: hypothetical protein ACLVH8_11130 [Fusobacterium sp.]
MKEKILEKIETNNIKSNENEGLKYEFSAEISAGNEKGIVHCYTVNGMKQYKVVAKDGNFDGVDHTKDWEEKLEKDKEENEREREL